MVTIEEVVGEDTVLYIVIRRIELSVFLRLVFPFNFLRLYVLQKSKALVCTAKK